MNNAKTMVVLAAGMGSRYGGNKQIYPLGPGGESILDYSIHDAIQVGFSEVVLIIRPEIESEVKAHFLPRWEDKISIRFAYQTMEAFAQSYPFNPERKKPWGTAHALLCVKDIVHNPFIIINADDFYGRDAFIISHNILEKNKDKEQYGLVVYELEQTISKHGEVNRGVCQITNDGHLVAIEECLGIKAVDGHIGYEKQGTWHQLDSKSPVSMNFFYFSPHIFQYAEDYFYKFLQQQGQELKSEYFIPKLVQLLMDNHNKKISTLKTKALWFGVTYKEDNIPVQESLAALIKQGEYPARLGQ